jgi:hypothetical protein
MVTSGVNGEYEFHNQNIRIRIVSFLITCQSIVASPFFFSFSDTCQELPLSYHTIDTSNQHPTTDRTSTGILTTASIASTIKST